MALNRELGLFGATMMGLGSILGTGVFVSIGIAAGVAGPAVIVAIVMAAAVATCNALNSAQLAANHPVSGGTYEYGYRWLNPTLIVAVGAAGAERLQTATTEKVAPLEIVAREFPFRVHWLVAIGAMTAMLGVLLNLLLGLSRVMLAMGRRGDMPATTANVSISVLVVGSIVSALAATGRIETTWAFSAFTVLIYYAVTNLAALRLSRGERLYGRAWAWCGLIACLALAFAIEPGVWASGLGILAVGLVWRYGLRRTAP